MKREDLRELHYITPIANLISILENGILSHKRAASIPHESVAMREIQDRREIKVVPGTRPLHDYVNLYICARNPMMYKRQSYHREICVIRVSPSVLDIPGTVISDQNASSNYARFGSAPDALHLVDKILVFADNWTNPYDQIDEWRHKSIKCAEVLVPDCVGPHYILGVYVSEAELLTKVSEMSSSISAEVNKALFFK